MRCWLNILFLLVGEAAQVHNVQQIIPDAWRSEISHVRTQRKLAVPVPRVSARFQQTDKSAESPISTHRCAFWLNLNVIIVLNREMEGCLQRSKYANQDACPLEQFKL